MPQKSLHSPSPFYLQQSPLWPPYTSGSAPRDIAFNPYNGFMYVANGVSNTVSVIDSATNTVIDTIPVGTQPFGIAFNPENGFLYVANFGGGNTAYAISPLTTTFSDGCNCTIGNAGHNATCTVTNACGGPA